MAMRWWKVILPVFAGMVPGNPRAVPLQSDSPRIRGDGPPYGGIEAGFEIFSPYSRGWSQEP